MVAPKMMLALVVIMLSISAVLMAANDPSVGTWKLNLAKSKYTGVQGPKSNINIFEPTPEGMKVTVRIVSAEGKENSTERIEIYDGVPHPMKGAGPGGAAVSVKRIDPYTVEGDQLANGKVSFHFIRTVSKDGKTMTVKVKGTLAQGQTYDEIRVFDKQ